MIGVATVLSEAAIAGFIRRELARRERIARNRRLAAAERLTAGARAALMAIDAAGVVPVSSKRNLAGAEDVIRRATARQLYDQGMARFVRADGWAVTLTPSGRRIAEALREAS